MQIPMEYNSFGHTFDKPLYNTLRQRHTGLDINENHGSSEDDFGLPILAPLAGRVVFSGRSGGWGRMLVVRHDLPYPFEYKGKIYKVIWTRHAHLKKLSVGLDEPVNEGQKIGECGGSGRLEHSYASHLHWDVILRHLDEIGGWHKYSSFWSSEKVHKYYASPLDFTEKYNAFLEERKKKVNDLEFDKIRSNFEKFQKKGYFPKSIRYKTTLTAAQVADAFLKSRIWKL